MRPGREPPPGSAPATVDGTTRLQPLTVARDLDRRGWLGMGVSTFNFHMHLPHYAVPTTT